MRFVEPPLTSPWRGRPGDLDGLLSEFFRSELPRQWTAPELPDEQPTLPLPRRQPVRRSAWRSRFALAASVALLLGGAALLSGKFKEISAPATHSFGSDSSADKDFDRPGHRPRTEWGLKFDRRSEGNLDSDRRVRRIRSRRGKP